MDEKCLDCGRSIPKGQDRKCSVCVGDPFWGDDGYLLEQIVEDQRSAFFSNTQLSINNGLDLVREENHASPA